MSTLDRLNRAEFLAIDDGSIQPDYPVSAAMLELLGSNANRLLTQGDAPILNLMFDGYQDPLDPNVRSGFSGQLFWPARLNWTEFLPGPFPRFYKPGMSLADVYLIAALQTGSFATIQVETSLFPFRSEAKVGDPNVFSITGSGTGEWASSYTLSSLPIHPSGMEWFRFWIRGHMTDTLGDTSVSGVPNTGRVAAITGRNTMVDAQLSVANTWHTVAVTGDRWDAHALVLTDTVTGEQILAPRDIVGVHRVAGLAIYAGSFSLTGALEFAPEITDVMEQRIFGGINMDFSIYELPRVTIANIAIYTRDR